MKPDEVEMNASTRYWYIKGAEDLLEIMISLSNEEAEKEMRAAFRFMRNQLLKEYDLRERLYKVEGGR